MTTIDNSTDSTSEVVDVVVVGGGPAGLSAALALARSRRTVTVVDAGHPRNAPSPHMHGVLGHDGRAPSEFVELARRDVARYDGARLVEAGVIGVARGDDGLFSVELDNRRTVTSRRLLVASGLTDELPDITGLAPRWGRDVLHCAYCHGWEVRDQAIAVVSSGPMGVHQASLFRQLSDDITLFVHTGSPPTDEEAIGLDALGIRIVGGRVAAVVVVDDRITALRMENGDVIDADAVVVAPRMVARSPILESLGLEAVAHPLGSDVGLAFPASPTGQTTIPGVWATGNVVDLTGTVPAVTAAGYMTGAAINADLITEQTERAVEARRIRQGIAPFQPSDPHEPRLPMMDAAFWDARYGSADRIWSGEPNPHLVNDIAGIQPGRALDVGAGEGADAIWLARQGWTVEAVDLSRIALERGRTHAAALGSDIADRITWTTTDVLVQPLPAGPFDLVSLQFMHFHSEDRIPLFERCLAAVATGGVLMIVAHHPSDMDTTVRRPRIPDAFYTADDIARMLDDSWTILASDARPRPATDADGNTVTIHDTVLIARRAG